MQAINTAILSFGMSGQVFHAPFIHLHKGFRFYAVWERTKNLAGEKYPGVKTYRTIEELLADDAVEMVIVNTPNTTHYQYTKMALMAGKHVIVEKPFTVRVEEGEELIALAKEKNRLLSVYHNRRFDSDYKAVRKVVEEKTLGGIVEAEFHFDRYKPGISPKLHKEEPVLGTGSLYDLGSHLVDQALQLFGMPQAVFADIRVIRPASKVDDYFELLLYYPSLRVRLHSSYLVREALPAYILHGSQGSFIKHKSDVQETALQNGAFPGTDDWGTEPEELKGLLHTEVNGKVIRETVPSTRGNYMDYFEDIYQALRHGKEVPVTATDGLNVIRIIRAAFASTVQKRLVSLQP
ncbi:MAG TPA: Gfo/Idh/MocA family oxidoreductase [Flavisolibacter sp.]